MPTGEKKKTFIFDVSKFVGKPIVCFLFGGEVVKGILIEHDAVSNCLLELEKNKKIFILGRAITAIASL